MADLASSSSTRLLTKDINQRPQKVLDHSDPRYVRIVQNNLGNTMTLGTSDGQTSTFKIPGSYVFNLFNSYFAFDETQGAIPGGAGIYYYRFADLVPHIARLQIKTVTGQVLICDIPDCHKYTNAVLRYETRLEDMLLNDKPSGTGTTSNGVFEGLIPPQTMYQVVNGTTIANPGGDTAAHVGTWANTVFALNKRTQSTNVKNQTLEPLYYLKGSVDNTLFPISNRIPLSLFKNTICAVDKYRYFGDDIEITIVWAKQTNVCFIGKVLPADGDAAVTGPTQTVNLSNLELQLCVENNTMIVNDMKTKFMGSGFSEYIPYLHHRKINRTGASNHNISIDITRSIGAYIQKIIWVPFNTVDDVNTQYYHGLGAQYANATGAQTANTNIKFFNPVLNSNNMYSAKIDISKNEAYILQRKKLKGTCITSSDDFAYNFTWYQDWTEQSPLWMKPLEKFEPDVYIDGYLVTDPIRYEIDVEFGADAARDHYLYAVMLKQLTVNKDMITLQ